MMPIPGTVSRAGERVIRYFQHTRWIDGGPLLWMGRRRRPGRCGIEPLRFDRITEEAEIDCRRGFR